MQTKYLMSFSTHAYIERNDTLVRKLRFTNSWAWSSMFLLDIKKSLLSCVAISTILHSEVSDWWWGKEGVDYPAPWFRCLPASPSFPLPPSFQRWAEQRGRTELVCCLVISSPHSHPLHHVRVVYKGHPLRSPGWTLWPHCWITFPESARRSCVTSMNFWPGQTDVMCYSLLG